MSEGMKGEAIRLLESAIERKKAQVDYFRERAAQHSRSMEEADNAVVAFEKEAEDLKDLLRKLQQ